MKKITILLILICITLALWGMELELANPGFSFKSEEFQFSMRYKKPALGTSLFEWGDIAKSGLIKTLKDPYSSSSFLPETRSFGEEKGIYGTVLKLGGFRMFSLSERGGAGIYYGSNGLESFVYYMHRSKIDHSNQKLFSEVPNGNIIYSGISCNINKYKIIGLASFSLYGVVNGLVSSSYEGEIINLSIIVGDIAAFSKEREFNLFKISAGVNGKWAEFNAEFTYGKDPVYSEEYRRMEINHTSSLNLDTLRLSFKESHETKITGKIKRDFRFNVESGSLSFGFDSSDKQFMKYRFDAYSISYEAGKYVVDIPIKFSGEKWSADLSIKSSGEVSIKLSFSEFP